MTTSETKCFLCDKPAAYSYPFNRRIVTVDCVCCGKYGITDEAQRVNYPPSERWKLSAYVREKDIQKLPIPIFFSQPFAIDTSTIPGSITVDSAKSDYPKEINERLDRTLLNLVGMSSHLGFEIDLTPDDWPVAFAENSKEFGFLISQLEADNYIRGLGSPTEFMVTVKGWNRIAEMQRAGPLSKQVFVAMNFDPVYEDVYETGIKQAIEKDCLYGSFRVDRAQHNEDINDKIIAEMRKSKFMVADFSGHRHGVYFEAGFMLGLGRPVIFACKEGEIIKAHFDTSHRNHIIWKDASDFREKLKLRILATIIP